ncbi:MAG TPA: DUF350 domain-containing protein [Leptospiraceae bacterium]|nr:DUF350 domain-containing protein [Spirochaetaceae bacterium]HBS04121.1 DUF350 domain-containing protein [Leptospiraceae bacterium]|tara:strand:- start:53305 stop:53523 length:219 start_codon:yes stop_codon:yes gene_type:complete
MEIIQLNFIYAVAGCLLGLVSILTTLALIDWIFGFRIRRSLRNGNQAVALATGGAIVGLGLAYGLIIGLSLN